MWPNRLTPKTAFGSSHNVDNFKVQKSPTSHTRYSIALHAITSTNLCTPFTSLKSADTVLSLRCRQYGSTFIYVYRAGIPVTIFSMINIRRLFIQKTEQRGMYEVVT